ncbi:MAG: ATP-binding protein [Polyangiales bacterium]
MNEVATVVFAWAAVSGHVGLYYALLHRRRRSDREHLAFGRLSGAMFLVATGRGFALLAPFGPVPAHVADVLSGIGAITGTLAFADVCRSLAGVPRRARKRSVTWAAVGLAALAFGLTLPLRGEGSGCPPFVLQRQPLLVSLELVGAVYLSLGVALAALSLVPLVRAAVEEKELRVPTGALALLGVAGVHDALARLLWVRTPTLAEHAYVVLVIAMGGLVVRRFVRSGEALESRTVELTERYEELRATQEQLVWKEQLAAVGELSAVIAHEVRNPLAIIKNAVSGLRRATLRPTDRATLLDILDEETDKLNRLMHDLLAYARPVMPKGQPLDIDELVRRTVERARGSNPHAGMVDVRFELEGAPPTVYGDPELLRHALVNIVDNAFQAMPAGGTLMVRARRGTLLDVPSVQLSFEDTGEGMDTIVRSKARDPFFTTRPTGTGLGLAIVERVIRNHGGRVDIDSGHGIGTTVTVTLPEERTSMIPIPPPEGHDGRFATTRRRPT